MILAAAVLALTTTSPVELPPEPSVFDPAAVLVAPLRMSPSPVLGVGDSLLSYTYIEAGFTTYDLSDANNKTVDTYYGKGSLGLLGFLYGFLTYENSSVDIANTNTNQVTIGAGAHIEPLPPLSLYADIGWLYNSVSSDDNSIEGDENGYRVEGGVRWIAIPWSGGGVELDGALGYIDVPHYISSNDNPSYWNAGARIHFLGHFSVGALYERLDVDDRLIGNVRFSF